MVVGETTASVILRTRPYRESDLIVVMLTPEKGKISVMARGARKSQRRFSGGLAVGARGLAEIESREKNLRNLFSFHATSLTSTIGRDLDVFAYTAYVCEISEQLVAEGHSEPVAFALSCEILAKLCSDGAHPSLLRRFELGILDALGYLPHFDRCCQCDATWEGTSSWPMRSARFDLDRGGIFCSEHADRGVEVSISLLELIRSLRDAKTDVRRCLDTASESERRALRDMTLQLLRVHLRHPLQSLGLLGQLRGNNFCPPSKAGDPDNAGNRRPG